MKIYFKEKNLASQVRLLILAGMEKGESKTMWNQKEASSFLSRTTNLTIRTNSGTEISRQEKLASRLVSSIAS